MFKGIRNTIKQWFAAVATAKHDIINGEELFRAVWTALGAGSAPAVIVAVCQAIAAHSLDIFPHTVSGSLLTALATLIAELYRRKGHAAP